MYDNLKPGLQLLLLAATYICCLFLGVSVAQLVLYSLAGEIQNLNEAPPMYILIYHGIAHSITHLGAFFIFLRSTNTRWNHLFLTNRINTKVAIAIPFAAIACIYILSAIGAFCIMLFENAGLYHFVEEAIYNQELLEPLVNHSSAFKVLFSVVVLAALPAIGEELIFRGILQTKLIQATQNRHFAIVISALIFSAIHLQPVNLLGIAILGIVLGYLFDYTRSIWPSILLHFCINAFQIVLPLTE